MAGVLRGCDDAFRDALADDALPDHLDDRRLDVHHHLDGHRHLALPHLLGLQRLLGARRHRNVEERRRSRQTARQHLVLVVAGCVALPEEAELAFPIGTEVALEEVGLACRKPTEDPLVGFLEVACHPFWDPHQ